MKIKLLFLCLFSISSLFAQVDVAEPTTQIPVEENLDAEKENTTTESPFNKPIELPDFKPEKGEEDQLDLPIESATINLDYKREKSFNMTEQSTLLNPGVLFEKRFENKSKQIKKAGEEYGINVDGMSKFKRNIILGSFTTKHNQVRIILQDHQAVDGDMILVKVNGEILIPRVILHNGFQTFTIGVNEGANNFEFVALNQGESGPNTALVAAKDQDGFVVPPKEWNLATSYTASFVITRIVEKE